MAREPKPFNPRQVRTGRSVMRFFSPINTWLYRISKGRIGGRFPGGAPIALLITTGRRSGLERTVPLLYMDDGDDIVLVASQGGMPTHPEWYLNLCDDPAVEVEVRGKRSKYRARTATPEERAELWPRLVKMYKGYATYQARTEREIPVVICSPVAS